MNSKAEPHDLRPPSEQLIDTLRTAMSSSRRVGENIVFPTLLAPELRRFARAGEARIATADLALKFLATLGFLGDRTRMNLYGYPGLLRNLMSPPPWIDEGDITAERAADIRPLCQHLSELSAVRLLTCYEAHVRTREELLRRVVETPIPPEVAHFQSPQTSNRRIERTGRRQLHLLRESFRELLELGECLGPGTCDNLHKAVFDDDPFVAPGAPDLLVWLPRSDPPLWFFMEVKGPRDVLRPSQVAWVRSNWDRIQGRFVLLIIGDHRTV